MTTETKTKKNKKVLIAFSGGVDSAVASYLLKKEGFLVTGVFLDFFGDKQKQKKAKEISKKIGIPLLKIDARKNFKKEVIDYFIKELKEGRTPNPCVVCNREIKFKILFEKLKEQKIDYIATGHYVRVLKEDNNENIILKAKDVEKDQSYFLWKIKKEVLDYILFPIGDLTKDKVKKIAKEKNIIREDYKESQEVCFIDNMDVFINNFIGKEPGNIVDIDGKMLGKHKGLFYYTVGQRKGMNLPHGPYYVLKKDVKSNLLIVTNNKNDLLQRELFYEKSNFFNKMKFPLKVDVKIRYNGLQEKAEIKRDKVFFKRKVMAVTPGQSVVFYNKEKLLGGGVIK